MDWTPEDHEERLRRRDLEQGIRQVSIEEIRYYLPNAVLRTERDRRLAKSTVQLLVRNGEWPPSESTKSGYAPYIPKKRKTTTEDHHTQVPSKVHITPLLPDWTPPMATPPPQTESLPHQPQPPSIPTLSTTSQPIPTTSQTQPQQIPSLMSIKFTPHAIRQFKSRLQHSIPAYHAIPKAPTRTYPVTSHRLHTPTISNPLIPLIHHLLNTLHHITIAISTYTGFNILP